MEEENKNETEGNKNEHQEERGEDRGYYDYDREPRGRGIMDGMVPDVLKRLFIAGLGAVFASEEGLRRLAAEFSLPKEMAGFLISQAQNTKNELFRIVAGEVRGFLESVNFGKELQKVLTSLTFEVKMQIRLRPSEEDQTVKPEVKGTMKVVSNDEEKEEPEPEEE